MSAPVWQLCALQQAKELDPEEVKQRLARIAGREQGEERDHAPGHGVRDIRDRLNQALGRGTTEPRQKDQHELEDARKRQRQLELERQRELDRDLG